MQRGEAETLRNFLEMASMLYALAVQSGNAKLILEAQKTCERLIVTGRYRGVVTEAEAEQYRQIWS